MKAVGLVMVEVISFFRHPAVGGLKRKKSDKEQLVDEMEFTEIETPDAAKTEVGEANNGVTNSDAGMRFKIQKHG